MKKLVAEFLGTFMVVSAICGIGALSPAGAAPWAVALGAGFAVFATMSALGHVSGGHFNPALTVGLAAAGRHPWNAVPGYLFAQVLGGITAGFDWFVITGARTGTAPVDLGTFVANGFDMASPAHIAIAAVALAEALATAMLVIVFTGATSRHAASIMAPIAVGSAVAALMLLMLPIDNGGLNPARSTASALLGGQLALAQLWLFWAAPLVGAVVGGWIARYVTTVD
jgi:aquaporin Z